MIKLIRKNQKIVMVVLGVVLMVMFVANIGPQGTQQTSPVLRQVATLGGAKITQLQLNNRGRRMANRSRSLGFVEPNQPNAAPQPFRRQGSRSGTQPARSSRPRNPARVLPLFFLLKEEADREGIAVSDEELQSIITNNVAPSGPARHRGTRTR